MDFLLLCLMAKGKEQEKHHAHETKTHKIADKIKEVEHKVVEKVEKVKAKIEAVAKKSAKKHENSQVVYVIPNLEKKIDEVVDYAKARGDKANVTLMAAADNKTQGSLEGVAKDIRAKLSPSWLKKMWHPHKFEVVDKRSDVKISEGFFVRLFVDAEAQKWRDKKAIEALKNEVPTFKASLRKVKLCVVDQKDHKKYFTFKKSVASDLQKAYGKDVADPIKECRFVVEVAGKNLDKIRSTLHKKHDIKSEHPQSEIVLVRFPIGPTIGPDEAKVLEGILEHLKASLKIEAKFEQANLVIQSSEDKHDGLATIEPFSEDVLADAFSVS